MLCCEIDGIFDTIVSDTDLLSYLFSIFKQPRPLNSSRAGYFARVLASLLTKCSSPVMSFVKGKQLLLKASGKAPLVLRKITTMLQIVLPLSRPGVPITDQVLLATAKLAALL